LKSPFNERKYKKLLEGLEASEVMYNQLKESKYFRFDDEYYSKTYLEFDLKISNYGFSTLFDIADNITDFGAYSQTNQISFKDDGVLFLRNQDVKSNYIDISDNVFIDENVYDKLTLKLCENDVLIPRVGTLGNAAVVKKEHLPCSANQNLAVIRLKKHISPYFVSTVLASKIGIYQVNRTSTGNVQQWLNLEAIGNLKIPNISFQNKIENIVKSAHSKQEQSQYLYHQAEELLLETIGLKDFKPSTKTTNIKSFKESFLATGRLDAEYYQPKYEEIIAKIKKQPHDVLSNLVSIKKSIEPGSDVYTDEGLPFIRVSDYNKFGISTPEKCLSSGFCKENAKLLKSLYPIKETILFSKDGSVGTAYMVCENMQAVTSGAILHLTVKDKTKVLPEYLTLVLNSKVVQQQAERDAGGSIILHWRINEIENVVVPVVDYKIQQQIAELIEQSFSLRAESERLLEEAKGMVEREIEGGK